MDSFLKTLLPSIIGGLQKLNYRTLLGLVRDAGRRATPSSAAQLYGFLKC